MILESILEEYEDTLNDFQEDALAQYAWEQDLERTWEKLIENDGELKFSQSTKARKNIDRPIDSGVSDGNNIIVKRGIIR